jgi:hypothetical protein
MPSSLQIGGKGVRLCKAQQATDEGRRLALGGAELYPCDPMMATIWHYHQSRSRMIRDVCRNGKLLSSALENSFRLAEISLLICRISPIRLSIASREADDAPHVDWGVPYAGLRNVVKKLGMRDLMQKITKFQPVPDYDSAGNPR